MTYQNSILGYHQFMPHEQRDLSERVSQRADFSKIRYAQCWEDADILLEGLDIQPGDTCLAIASAGDNSLAMLTRNPARVIALDLSPAQLACLELRVAAYRALEHAELLVLIGSRPGHNRQALYHRCRSQLSPAVRAFWDSHSTAIDRGIGVVGKFERYFTLFRRYALPWVQSRATVDRLLQGGNLAQRQAFYHDVWDSWRWRSLFRLFFSRFVMGRAGRDPSFFKYVQGSVADRILSRTQYALTQLDPAENPYLQWILTGQHGTALPYALRPQQFETIRANLDRLEWHCSSVEDYLEQVGNAAIDRYNLSDIFEYLSPESYQQLLQKLVNSGRKGGRLAYWNMLAPRSRPAAMADQLKPLTELAQTLHAQDKAFFYSAFVVEEIL
ncbi:MAG TPA: BtaA family protein [Coleofasciculaceae cyanobacterium]